MIEQELNARKNVDEKINEINETNKIDDNSKHIDYDKYIKRKYSFYEKIKGVVTIDSFPGDVLTN